MDDSTKNELKRLALRMSSTTGRAVAIEGQLLIAYASGDMDTAEKLVQRSDSAKDEANEAFGAFIAYLDKL